MPTLFGACLVGDSLKLNNRIVMAPMTRTRTSEGDLPNALMAKYYGQRATAGLIVTEATDIAVHSKGYAWTPGIYTDAQVEGWRLVTDEVHRGGGKIFLQSWHVGRMAHTSLMPNGEAPRGVTKKFSASSFERRAFEHYDIAIHSDFPSVPGNSNTPQGRKFTTASSLPREMITKFALERREARSGACL